MKKRTKEGEINYDDFSIFNPRYLLEFFIIFLV